MVTIKIPQDTTFTFDVMGRYGCNTLDEALDSTRTDLPDQTDARPFDYIVLGGGSFGAVLTARLFNLDRSHAHRILVLEAGPLVLQEHVQNLPPDFSPPGKDSLGTVWGQPWESDSPMIFNKGFPGLAFCVGGRSLFWGGWSPYFIDSEVKDPSWPKNVVKDLMTPVLPPDSPKESYLDRAAREIGTDTTNDFVSGPLHVEMQKLLFAGLQKRKPGPGDDVLTGNRGSLAKVEHLDAPLAVSSSSPRPGFFSLNKFSAVQLLLRALRVAQAEAQAAARPATPEVQNTKKRLMLVDKCYVTRLERSGSRIVRVWARYGGVERSIEVPEGGKVFLALGTIENTRMALNTVREKPLIGRNLMAHLRSNLTFRVPRSRFGPQLDPDQEPDPVRKQLLRELQVSALFVKGIHTHTDGSKGHYHFQITASGLGELGMNSEAELFKKIPNIDDLDQFKDLTDPWVVITLRGIGEMVGDKTSNDPQNRVTQGPPDGNGVPRAKVRLETNWSDPNDPRVTDRGNQLRTKDNDLWEAMDRAAREVAAIFAGAGRIEYLSRPNDAANAHWQKDPPARELCQDTLSSTHHEAGTLWMGEKRETSVTDETGRIWETDNLYVVGPALLPTIGSPNPMLSGVALARRTADKIATTPAAPALEQGFQALFDGTEKTFQRWKIAGPGVFALQDGLLVAQPDGDHSVLFYAAERFNNYVLRLQFRLPGPVDAFGKAIGNSGVYLRFRYPHTKWADVNAQEPRAQGNPAWVAVATGFEVQIDEQGRDQYLEKHRTGAIYNVPTGQGGEPKEQTYTPGPVLQPGKWYEFQVTVNGDQYTVALGEPRDGQATNYATVTMFSKPAGQYARQGLAPNDTNASGYIGVQAHTGKVAFRHIRIQKK